jgi:hypothetical protein
MPSHVDFELILDLTDAVDASQNLLRHLLVVVRAHGATQHDAALLGFEPQRTAGKLNYYRLKPVGWGKIVATD